MAKDGVLCFEFDAPHPAPTKEIIDKGIGALMEDLNKG